MRNSFQIKERVAVNEHSIQYCFVHPSSIVYIRTLSNYSAQWKQNIEEWLHPSSANFELK